MPHPVTEQISSLYPLKAKRQVQALRLGVLRIYQQARPCEAFRKSLVAQSRKQPSADAQVTEFGQHAQ